MSNELVLYDLARRGDHNTCWSINVWKTRLVLNYKQLPYRTVWLDHTTVNPKLSALGVTPNPSGNYTVPVLQLGDGSYLMDSAAIAEKLESLHPSPSLQLETGLQDKAAQIVGVVASPLFPTILLHIGRDVIVEHSVPEFRARRMKAFGMSLEEYEAAKGGEQAWKIAETTGFPQLKAFLTEHKKDEGPFILGSKVCYGDFHLMAMMEAFRRVGQDIFDRLMAYDESFGRLYEACKGWIEKDT